MQVKVRVISPLECGVAKHFLKFVHSAEQVQERAFGEHNAQSEPCQMKNSLKKLHHDRWVAFLFRRVAYRFLSQAHPVIAAFAPSEAFAAAYAFAAEKSRGKAVFSNIKASASA
eukprot:4913931-Amphidinium_carterae.1